VRELQNPWVIYRFRHMNQGQETRWFRWRLLGVSVELRWQIPLAEGKTGTQFSPLSLTLSPTAIAVKSARMEDYVRDGCGGEGTNCGHATRD
jgi:hypothetical protein